MTTGRHVKKGSNKSKKKEFTFGKMPELPNMNQTFVTSKDVEEIE